MLCFLFCYLNPMLLLDEIVSLAVATCMLVFQDNRTMTADHLALCNTWHIHCWDRWCGHGRPVSLLPLSRLMARSTRNPEASKLSRIIEVEKLSKPQHTKRCRWKQTEANVCRGTEPPPTPQTVCFLLPTKKIPKPKQCGSRARSLLDILNKKNRLALRFRNPS